MGKTITTMGLLTLSVAAAQAALIFGEDFGSLADGTTLTTSVTDFTYVRTSTGSGAADPDAVNPANVGSGSSGFLQSPSGSITGVGVEDSLTSSAVYTMAVDFRFISVTSGDIVFGIGSGTAFTGNSGFSTSQGLVWLQSDAGNFERRTGSWNNVGGGTTFTDNTNYSLHVIANGGGSLLSYAGGSVAAGTMDIYLNGSLLDDDVAVTNSLSADGFRIYSVSGTGVEIDNVSLWNEAIAVPEPSSIVLLGLGSIATLLRRRR